MKKIIEISTDNTTRTGFECQKIGSNEWKKLRNIWEVQEECGEEVFNILDRKGHYIGECQGKCLFNN